MSQPPERPFVCPEGLDFLTLVSEQEDSCENATRDRILTIGKKVPVCLRNLGTVLSLLDRAASCFWGCRGGDHTIEYLAGRVCSSSRAALRLLLFGFYDESLSITRTIGEIANLLWLFNREASVFGQWKQLTTKQRKEQFGPMKVRLRLEAMKIPVPVDQFRYAELSEVATHATPETKPQAHNPFGIPVIGGTYQEGGVIVALNELAAATALALVPIPKLLRYDDQKRNDIKNAALSLLDAVGAVGILNVKAAFAETLRQSGMEAKGVAAEGE